jgi:AcrR family transcriptional regulator
METILEAAAQILETGGKLRFTTNRIAAHAGFSIGTVYQYFAHKDAFYAALAHLEVARIEAEIENAAADGGPGEAEAYVRRVARAIIGVMAGRMTARRVVIVQLIRIGHAEGFLPILQRLFQKFTDELARFQNGDIRPLTPLAAFVLTRAMMGAVRAAVMEKDKILLQAEFEDELVRLAMSFLSRP